MSEVVCTIAIYSGQAARVLHFIWNATRRSTSDRLAPFPCEIGEGLGIQGIDQVEEFLGVGDLFA